METIYSQIIIAKSLNKKLLAILLDPDVIHWETIDNLTHKISTSPATHIFVGGSHVDSNRIDELIIYLKQTLTLPIVLFPGNPSQISNKADGLLFLSLLSGRNPDFLIEHQVNAVPIIQKTHLEVISTGYILIESGTKTAVETVSKTKPLDRNNADYVLQTAQAGVYMGSKLIYLEAGSGAKLNVPTAIIEKVARNINIPLLVGGGLRSKQSITEAYNAGATMVIIGTAFEADFNFFDDLNLGVIPFFK
jgi:phosphoglycerol geranylgeranyltransferase